MTTIAELAKKFIAGKITGGHHSAQIQGDTYRLHGHPIAKRTDKGILYNWCGYYTPTTANHIEHIMEAQWAASRDIPLHRDYYGAANPRLARIWGITTFYIGGLTLAERIAEGRGRGPNKIQKRYRLPTVRA